MPNQHAQGAQGGPFAALLTEVTQAANFHSAINQGGLSAATGPDHSTGAPEPWPGASEHAWNHWPSPTVSSEGPEHMSEVAAQHVPDWPLGNGMETPPDTFITSYADVGVFGGDSIDQLVASGFQTDII